MQDTIETDNIFQDLLTLVIDSRDGYKEALEETQPANMAAFSNMLALKERHVAVLSDLLRNRGVHPDESGSLLTALNHAIFSLRTVFGGVEENVLPGLIDGEGRIIAHYDDAIVAAAERDQERDELTKQRLELNQMLNTIRALQHRARFYIVA